MANVESATLTAKYDWDKQQYLVTGKINFMFGATMYNLDVRQYVLVPSEYRDVAEQIEHIFMDLSAELGKLGNAKLSIKAEKDASYL